MYILDYSMSIHLERNRFYTYLSNHKNAQIKLLEILWNVIALLFTTLTICHMQES